jgi:hypothetical protein
MKKLAILALVILTSITQTHVAEAATSLKVTVKEEVWIWLEDEEEVYVADDPEALAFKKKITAYAKTSKAKSEALAECKRDSNYFNMRIKVLDARNGTAGLGNLKSVTVSNMKVAEQRTNLPEYTQEEEDELWTEYDSEEDYPDYIEEGYVSYYIEFICSHTGKVSLITSNAYKIYIDGDFAGEYSRTELAKKKWAITFVDE